MGNRSAFLHGTFHDLSTSLLVVGTISQSWCQIVVTATSRVGKLLVDFIPDMDMLWDGKIISPLYNSDESDSTA